jgi:hypothetical protein
MVGRVLEAEILALMDSLFASPGKYAGVFRTDLNFSLSFDFAIFDLRRIIGFGR